MSQQRTLRDQLAVAVGQEHKLLFFAQGSRPAALNHLSIPESLAKFKTDFLTLCPLSDRLGRTIAVRKVHFRKLVNLKHKLLGKQAVAWKIIEEIENGTFDVNHYEPVEPDRIQTLFWVPEVITDPDAIYYNGHCVVKAEEVYVRVYDKMGSKVKLVFVSKFGAIVREFVTSYLTDPETALRCLKGNPIYVRPSK